MVSFRELLYRETGITLADSKQSMVSARITKRLRALRFSSFGEYLRLLRSPQGRSQELDEFIDVMTTNKTEFFRERRHFDILLAKVLKLVRAGMAPGEDFRVWSAACSTGEEPYSLAMLLYDYFLCVPEDYSILATDICREALQRAQRAIYPSELAASIPSPYAERFVLRGKGQQEGSCRIAPEIRRKVSFKRLNLMDSAFNISPLMHVIWCRNVMIYFDAKSKTELCRKFSHLLVPGGFIFVGHSESLNGLTNEFEQFSPAVYRKPLERS